MLSFLFVEPSPSFFTATAEHAEHAEHAERVCLILKVGPCGALSNRSL